MAALAGEKPSRGVWLGCCCTLAGTVLITLDHSAATITDQGSAAASSLGSSSVMLNFLLGMLTNFWGICTRKQFRHLTLGHAWYRG